MDLYDFALWLGFPAQGAAVMRDVSPTPQEARELLERFDRDEKDFFAALRSLPRPERTALRLLTQYAFEQRSVWEALGLSEEIYRDTMRDLVLWYDECVRRKGEPGHRLFPA